MTKEEIKSKLALTEIQQQLVDKFNNVLEEMKEANIGLVLDETVHGLSFSAFNEAEVLEMDNDGWVDNEDDAVDVEDCIDWLNLGLSDYGYHSYSSGYGNLHAVFGCKSSVNESMMSAAL